MVLIARSQRPVTVLLELDEGALRHRRRVVRLVRRRWPQVALARHRRRPWWILLRAPKRGTQIGEVERGELLGVHGGDVGRRPDVTDRNGDVPSPSTLHPQVKLIRKH